MTLVDTFAAEGLPPREQWPDLLIEPFGYPDRLNFVTELVDRHVAEGRGDRPAIIGPGETIGYRELQSRIDRVCRVLVDELGMVSGNRVLLRAPNNAMLVITYLAVAKAGGIVVATMPLLRRKELSEIVERAEIRLALCDDRLLEEAEGLCDRLVSYGDLERMAAGKEDGFAPYDTASDDVCLIAFTSGTSGRPKGTMHFHRDILAICDTFSEKVVKPVADDVFIGSPPLAFTFGLGGLVTFPFRVGAATVLLERGAPPVLLEAIERFGATVCFTAPTAYRAMLGLGVDGKVGTLRRCVSAGETLPLGTWEAWRSATGLRLIDGIGATEMLHVFISAADEEIRPGATGKAVPGFEARVVDDEMRDVAPGVVGRLAVRGPTGCRYLRDPRQLDYVRDGWNLTGDAYLIDEDGYFHYQARTDDMIVTSGYNVAGPEVEEALIEHAAVLECGVVGVADDSRGTIVKAFVVLHAGHEPTGELAAELQDFVKNRIAPYKYPRAVEFIAALPRTESGKVQRFVLRQRQGG
jgi:2-aminobenzoate-CoA ligase